MRSVVDDALSIAREAFSLTAVWSMTYDDELPAVLEGDAAHVRRLVQNVVVAVCHSGVGGAARHISATLGRMPHSGEDRDGAVAVSLTFVLSRRGLSSEQTAELFDPYTSVAGTSLSVARAFARAMCGDVTCSNVEGLPAVSIKAWLCLHQPGAPEMEPMHGGDGGAAGPSPTMSAAAAAAQQEAPPPSMFSITQRMFESMTRSLDDMFTQGDINEDGSLLYTYVSPGGTKALGWPRDAYIGHSLTELVHPDDRDQFIRDLTVALEKQATLGSLTAVVELQIPRRMLLPDGSHIVLLTSGALDSRHWYSLCRNMSARSKREAALRSLLLSTSRELREPANAVLAASSMLQQHPIVKADAEAAFLVRASALLCQAWAANALFLDNPLTRRMPSSDFRLLRPCWHHIERLLAPLYRAGGVPHCAVCVRSRRRPGKRCGRLPIRFNCRHRHGGCSPSSHCCCRQVILRAHSPEVRSSPRARVCSHLLLFVSHLSPAVCSATQSASRRAEASTWLAATYPLLVERRVSARSRAPSLTWELA